MDRDDARFAAAALVSRISGDRDQLDRLAASSLVRLHHCAIRLRKAADGWPPALAAAAELEAICRQGGGVIEAEAAPDLQKVVDSLIKLAGEPERPTAPRNRAERRVMISRISKDRRIIVPPASVH